MLNNTLNQTIPNNSNSNTIPCQLFDDFINTNSMASYMLTILSSNLIHIPEGEEVFFDRLEAMDSPHYGKLKSSVAYHKQNNYLPTNCSKCKYSTTCSAQCKNMAEALTKDGFWNKYIESIHQNNRGGFK